MGGRAGGSGAGAGRSRGVCGTSGPGAFREWDEVSQESVTGGYRPQEASTPCSVLSSNPGPGPGPGPDPGPAVSASRCPATAVYCEL